jgi:hypothetical protein
MARGWESKSVEAQIEESKSQTASSPEQEVSAEARLKLQKKNGLLLSRKRIQQQLESSSNERYSELLRRTLASLEAEIAALD